MMSSPSAPPTDLSATEGASGDRGEPRPIDLTRGGPPDELLDQMARADAINSRLRRSGREIAFVLSSMAARCRSSSATRPGTSCAGCRSPKRSTWPTAAPSPSSDVDRIRQQQRHHADLRHGPRVRPRHVVDHQSAARSRTAADQPHQQPRRKSSSASRPSSQALKSSLMSLSFAAEEFALPSLFEGVQSVSSSEPARVSATITRRRRCRRLPARSHPARELRPAHVRVRLARRRRHADDRRARIHAQSGSDRQGTRRQDQRRRQRHGLRRRSGQRRNDRPLQPYHRRERTANSSKSPIRAAR